jgi:hypothetical protein
MNLVVDNLWKEISVYYFIKNEKTDSLSCSSKNPKTTFILYSVRSILYLGEWSWGNFQPSSCI